MFKKTADLVEVATPYNDGDGEVDDVGDDEDGQVVSRVLPLQFPVKLLNLLKRRCLSPPRVGIFVIIIIVIQQPSVFMLNF